MLVFNVSETYQHTTPESAEHGDFHETGFNWQDVEYTLRELVEYIKYSGYKSFDSDWLQTYSEIVCYRTGLEETLCLHVELPTMRHKRYYLKALELAGAL